MNDKKKSKVFTLIFVPHDGGKGPVNIKFSIKFIKIMSVMLFTAIFAAVCTLGYYGMDYLELQVKIEEMERLEFVNEVQSTQLEHYAREVNDFKTRFQEIEKLDRNIRNLLDFEEFDISQSQLTSLDKQLYNGGIAIGGEGLLLENAFVSYLDSTPEKMEILNSKMSPSRNSLEELQTLIKEEKKRLAGTPSIWPAQGRLTSPYGYRSHPISRRIAFHDGIDIGAPMGTPVYATADGVVADVGYDGGKGRTIIIDHPFGHRTLYAHLNTYEVETGDLVEKGDIIGGVGSTGFSTGPHLHYEIHEEGERIDPKKYLPDK